jgi:uncharacterized membrane protein
MKPKRAAFGIFRSQFSLEVAIESLKNQGFRSSDISVLLPRSEYREKTTKAPEGAATGATSGAIVGAGLGWLAGIGALAIPGVGPLIAAGPILAALAGVGVGGALGGMTGALIGLGIPEYEAMQYESQIKNGATLLSVLVEDPESERKACEALEISGAEDVHCTSEAESLRRPSKPNSSITLNY